MQNLEWKIVVWHLFISVIIQTGETSKIKKMRIEKPLRKVNGISKYFEVSENNKKTPVKDLRDPCTQPTPSPPVNSTTEDVTEESMTCILKQYPDQCFAKFWTKKKSQELTTETQQTVVCTNNSVSGKQNEKGLFEHAKIKTNECETDDMSTKEASKEKENESEKCICPPIPTQRPKIQHRYVITAADITLFGHRRTPKIHHKCTVEYENNESTKSTTEEEEDNEEDNEEEKCSTIKEIVAISNNPTTVSQNKTNKNLEKTNENQGNETSQLHIGKICKKITKKDDSKVFTSTTKCKATVRTTSNSCKHTKNITDNHASLSTKPTLPTFLSNYRTFGKYSKIILPIISQQINKTFLQNSSIFGDKKLENLNKYKNEVNHLLFTGATRKVENLNSDRVNKADWRHLWEARLQEGNSEYEDKSEMNPSNNLFHGTINFNDMKNINLSKSKHNRKHGVTEMTIDNKQLRNEKRNILYNKNSNDKVMKDENRMNYERNLNIKNDINKNLNISNLNRYILANIIKNLPVNKDHPNNIILPPELQENEILNTTGNYILYHIITESTPPITNKSSGQVTEELNKPNTKLDHKPSIQILNVTQVFNLYSKLVPLKKYLDALKASPLVSKLNTDQKKITKNNEIISKKKYKNGSEPSNYDYDHYHLKELLNNYLKNLIELQSQLKEKDETSSLKSKGPTILYDYNSNLINYISGKKMPTDNYNRDRKKNLNINSSNKNDEQLMNLLKDIVERVLMYEQITEENPVQGHYYSTSDEITSQIK